MALIDYPSSLPLPLIRGYSYSDSSHFIRTEMETGLARQRKRFTSTPTFFNIQFIYEQGAMSHFESWYANELNYGIELFNLQLAIGAGPAIASEVRITSPPSINSNNQHYNVTISIETVTKLIDPLLTDDQIEYINAQGSYAEAKASLDRLDLYMNTETKPAFEV